MALPTAEDVVEAMAAVDAPASKSALDATVRAAATAGKLASGMDGAVIGAKRGLAQASMAGAQAGVAWFVSEMMVEGAVPARARKNALGLGTVACTSGVVCAGDARLTSTCIAATAKLRALAAQLGVPPQAMVSAVDVHGRADAALLPEASPASGTAAESIVAAAAAGKDITF